MPIPGTIGSGSFFVEVNGKRAARKTDLLSHGGLIAEGEPTVVIGPLPVARKFDRFRCPDENPVPHVGGAIVSGSPNVIVGGQPAARMGDDTHCHGEGFDVSGLAAIPGAAGATDAATAAECQKLWAAYQAEAEALIAPAGDDHRQRNHIINGAYASLFQKNPKFVWAGLGAYASKQVGCAMDHSRRVMAVGPTDLQRGIAAYTYHQLGEGNKNLFLDVYPQHRFYEEHGWAKFQQCAGEKVPPVGGAMLDAFEALDRYERTGDPKYLEDHLEAVAYHEQVFILQRGIYNDETMRRILDANEGNMTDAGDNAIPGVRVREGIVMPKELVELGGGKPADVVMSSECSDSTPGQKKTIPFNPSDPNRNLYDMDDRMEWIMKDIGGYYVPHTGSQDHLDDLERLTQRGRDQGGNYP